MICTPNPVLCDKIEKNEMGGTCSTYGGDVTCIQSCGEKTRRQETTWKTQV
jgi:hypothetical protein